MRAYPDKGEQRLFVHFLRLNCGSHVAPQQFVERLDLIQARLHTTSGGVSEVHGARTCGAPTSS
jgi:hypothetical protein